VIAVNTAGLVLYLFAGPAIPLIFWDLNGWLLGREYFALVANRRMEPQAAKALRRANSGKVWLAGILMAAPLSIPLVNLVIPVLGVATFTHLFHRLAGKIR
jgi:CysZ protein